MEQENYRRNPTKSAIAIIVLVLIIYIYSGRQWLIIAAITIGVLSISSKGVVEKIDLIWFKISYFLGMIIPNILLTLIFYLLLTPLALLSRLFGKKDPLKLKNDSDSLFIKNREVINKAYFERLW